jgi:creatinine amidohydrolase/Fe(II)-dependent formamide hydrolase-like protein
MGDATAATPAKGEAWLARRADALANAIAELCRQPAKGSS